MYRSGLVAGGPSALSERSQVSEVPADLHIGVRGNAMRSFTVYDDHKRVTPTIEASIYLKDPFVASQPGGVGIAKVKIDGEAC